MAEFKVKTGRLDSAVGNLETYAAQLSQINTEITSIKNDLGFKIRSSVQIGSKLNNISGDVIKEQRVMKKMSSSLSSIAIKYNSVENSIYNNATGLKSIGNAFSTNVSESTGEKKSTVKKEEQNEPFKWNLLSFLQNEIGKIGTIGSWTTAVWKNIVAKDKKDKDKARVGLVKCAVDTVGKVVGVVSKGGSKANWRDFFLGTGNVTDKLEESWKETQITLESVLGVKSFKSFRTTTKTAWSNGWKEFSFSNAEKISSKIKVGAKWAGTLLSGVTNFIGNIDEQKKSNGAMSNRRVAEETVTETVIDVAKGIALGALATGAIVTFAPALATGAAGALVVGGATVAASWGLDLLAGGITHKFTGEQKNFTEAVSDFLLNNIFDPLVDKIGAKVTANKGVTVAWAH